MDRMARSIPVLIASFFLTLDTALVLAQPLTLKPTLKAGDEFALEVTRVRENSARPAQNTRSVTPVQIRVLTATPDGFTLEWVPGESDAEVPAGQAAVLRAAEKTLAGLKLKISLSADGEFTGLANQDEVVVQMREATNVIIKGMLQTVPEAERAGFEKFVGQFFSPTTLIAIVTRDIQTYFGMNGFSLTAGKTETVKIEQPNPLGGSAIPATFAVKLDSMTDEAAVLRTETIYNGDAFMKSMRTVLEQQSGKPIPDAEMGQIKMGMSDDGRFVFDRRVGLMKEVIVNRRMSSGPETRTDRWEIRLAQSPKR